jgi:protein-S-isoprenylcysteine O-methyltransferase Ste14
VSALDLKIPPVAVVLCSALLVWLVSWWLPWGAWEAPARVPLAIALAISGVVVSALGVWEFRKAKTTVNPTKPESTSALVTSGIYTRTRNPMYLGFLLALSGWAVFVGNALNLLVLPLFILYIHRFQIQPEETALAARFGQRFASYTARVRAWL